MKKILPFLITLSIFFCSTSRVSAAFSFNLDSAAPLIAATKTDEIMVNISITDLPSESYFRVAFQEGGGSDYFGYVKDNLGNWKKIETLSSDCSGYYRVTDTNTTSLVLYLKVGEDNDIAPGTYAIKGHRFTGSCASNSASTNTLNIQLNLPTPTPSPTPSPSPTPAPTQAPTTAPTAAPTATPTKTPTPIPTKSPTPKSTKTPSPSPEVLGEEATPIVSPTPEVESEAPPESDKRKIPVFPIVLIIVGVGLMGFAGLKLFKDFKKGYTDRGENSDTQIS